MSDLREALARIGEAVPERPTYADYHDGTDAVRSYAAELESLAIRLATRLERAERCRECNGAGSFWTANDDEFGVVVECAACSGTGKEQGR